MRVSEARGAKQRERSGPITPLPLGFRSFFTCAYLLVHHRHASAWQQLRDSLGGERCCRCCSVVAWRHSLVRPFASHDPTPPHPSPRYTVLYRTGLDLLDRTQGQGTGSHWVVSAINDAARRAFASDVVHHNYDVRYAYQYSKAHHVHLNTCPRPDTTPHTPLY